MPKNEGNRALREEGEAEVFQAHGVTPLGLMAVFGARPAAQLKGCQS